MFLFYSAAAYVFAEVEKRKIKGYICAISFPTLFYILTKELNRTKPIIILEKIRTIFKVAIVDEKVIDLSLLSDFKDFEDAVQYYSAVINKIDYIITRNKKDYKGSDIPILTPEEFKALITADRK